MPETFENICHDLMAAFPGSGLDRLKLMCLDQKAEIQREKGMTNSHPPISIQLTSVVALVEIDSSRAVGAK
ncbi:MAG: hypothetical protein ABJN14_02815 [Paracoccaceae bacterium]